MYHDIKPDLTSHNRFSTKHRHYSIEISDGPMFFSGLMIMLSGFLLIGTMLLAPILWQQIICVGRDALLQSAYMQLEAVLN
jgi:hypothetical protein